MNFEKKSKQSDSALEQLQAEWRRYDPHPPTAISETYHLCAKDLDGPIAAHKALEEENSRLASGVLDMSGQIHTLTGERDEFEGLLASATDLCNSWAREAGVQQADRLEDIKGIIDRLWSMLSARLHDAQQAVAAHKALLEAGDALVAKWREVVRKANYVGATQYEEDRARGYEECADDLDESLRAAKGGAE